MAPKSNDWCPYKEKKFEDPQTSTEGRRPCKGVRNWSEIAISHGMPRIASSHQTLERGKEGFFYRACRGSMTLLAS